MTCFTETSLTVYRSLFFGQIWVGIPKIFCSIKMSMSNIMFGVHCAVRGMRDIVMASRDKDQPQQRTYHMWSSTHQQTSEELKTVLSTTSLQIPWIERLLENYLTNCLFNSEDPGLRIAGNWQSPPCDESWDNSRLIYELRGGELMTVKKKGGIDKVKICQYILWKKCLSFND